MKKSTSPIKTLLLIVIGIIFFNFAGSYFYKRFDLTQDQRFTLSEAAKETIALIDEPIFIEVFLEGDFPSEFKRLQSETKQLLEEFEANNSNIKFKFVNPSEKEGDAEALLKFGAKPAQIKVKENGKISSQQIFPWAIASYQGKYKKIPLLKNQLGITSEERVNNSIQNLEYAFADGFNKLVHPKKRKVAVIKGNGEWDDKYVVDFFTTLRDYYFIAPFTLDSAAVSPVKTLEQIKEFDLIVIANPTEAFTENEKYVLDQYTMYGGASLWLVDAVELKKDTISGNDFAFGKELNLTDFFFKYGLRINHNLVKDVYSAPILLASGNERESQYQRYPWLYSPLSSSANNHPIVTNIEAVKFDYVSSIDTLPNKIHKTILLTSSPISKIVGMPIEIDINKEINKNLKILKEGPSLEEFKVGEIPLAVLLEGSFPSAYKNRVKPFKIKNNKDESNTTKMVIISDGNLIKNQLQGNRPLELGYDKWINVFYGNKEFLLNTVNYLLDDSGLINIRSKEISVPFLDPQKVADERSFWQWINILLPLVLLAIFGGLFGYFRKKKYT
ncbi:MAG: gliding motility-associated ABC transporter substrate-binding protein GldG [Flavobacteriaceae bacterium]|nr:gliding motility-associated ABC transporter substrate-binding protein GldG [Flavobacteriaceae bacterium]